MVSLADGIHVAGETVAPNPHVTQQDLADDSLYACALPPVAAAVALLAYKAVDSWRPPEPLSVRLQHRRSQSADEFAVTLHARASPALRGPLRAVDIRTAVAGSGALSRVGPADSAGGVSVTFDAAASMLRLCIPELPPGATAKGAPP